MKTILGSIVFLLIASSILIAGDLKGKITFKGTVPAAEQVKTNRDISVCGAQKEIRRVSVDASGGLQDVVVHIVGIKSSTPYTGAEPLVDQKHCQFDPYVVAVPLGGTLTITSEDTVLHNTHAYNQDGTTAFNYGVPIKGMKIHWKPIAPGVLRLKCDAGHTWMEGWVLVTDNNYFAVSGADGSFDISNVPAGSYQVEAWHPVLGKQTQTVKVGATGADVAFQFAAK